MTAFDWVLFDLDDTLLHYGAAQNAALSATLEGLGLEVTPEVVGAYATINSRHWRAFEAGTTTAARIRFERWAELITELGLDAEPVSTGDSYVRHLGASAVPMPHALEVVASLSTTHPLGVITNGFADVQRPRLAASGLDAHARVVVISDEVGVSKPDLAIFRATLDAMGHPEPSRVLIVGDNPVADIAGGAAAGMATCFYDGVGAHPAGWTPPGADHAISDLRDLLEIVQG